MAAITTTNRTENQANPSSGTSASRFLYHLRIMEKSYDPDTNTSNITYQAWANGTTTISSWYGTLGCTITKGSETLLSETKKVPSSAPINSSNSYFFEGSIENFPHNSDGTASITLTASFTIPSGIKVSGPGSVTTTLQLTTIPRANTIAAPNTDIGSSCIIQIYRTFDNQTTLTYSFGSETGTIVEKTSQSSYPWTVPTSLFNQIPSSANGTCTITATTYNGTTQIGSSTSATCILTANFDSSRPVISDVSVVDTNSTTIAITGDSSKLIKYVSKPKVTATLTPKNSASTKDWTVSCNDGQSAYQTTSSSSSVSISTTFSSSVSSNVFNVNCNDTRGYSAITQTVTPTMYDYVPLTISSTFYRTEPTTGSISLKYSGNYYNGSFNTTANTLTVRYRYKEKDTSTYSSWITLSPTISGNSYSQSLELDGTFDYKKSYTFQIQALDKIYSTGTVSQTQDVSQGEPIYWWNKTTFHINGDLYVTGEVHSGT